MIAASLRNHAGVVGGTLTIKRCRGFRRVERAPEPERLSDLDMQPEAKTFWTHVFYFEKHQHTMNYGAYRARGWPIGSGAIESACGQFGNRFKHGRMRWTKAGAEAGHQIKAAILSQDGRWEHRWPPPIPTLDLAAQANWN